MRKSIKISIVVLSILLIFGGTWYAIIDSRVKVQPISGGGNTCFFDGMESTYRELGSFATTKVKYTEWGSDHEIGLWSGIVVEDYPGIKLNHGGFNNKSDSIVVWGSGAWKIGAFDSRVVYSMEFDFSTQRVKLLNNGEELPIERGVVYTVRLNKDLSIEDFIAVKPSEGLVGVHPKVADFYTDLAKLK